MLFRSYTITPSSESLSKTLLNLAIGFGPLALVAAEEAEERQSHDLEGAPGSHRGSALGSSLPVTSIDAECHDDSPTATATGSRAPIS